MSYVDSTPTSHNTIPERQRSAGNAASKHGRIILHLCCGKLGKDPRLHFCNWRCPIHVKLETFCFLLIPRALHLRCSISCPRIGKGLGSLDVRQIPFFPILCAVPLSIFTGGTSVISPGTALISLRPAHRLLFRHFGF